MRYTTELEGDRLHPRVVTSDGRKGGGGGGERKITCLAGMAHAQTHTHTHISTHSQTHIYAWQVCTIFVEKINNCVKIIRKKIRPF